MSDKRLDLSAARSLKAGEVMRRLALPPVTMTQIVYYCAAARITDPIHFDRDYARTHGFPDAIVNGSLRVAWLAQILCDLVASPNRLADLRCTHSGLLRLGQPAQIEARASGGLEACEGGWLLPCEAETTVDSKVLDRAEGKLFFKQI
ncbi:hypothetical protein GCM10023144_10990 [Pigmentiphaga soli]|uniref:MaoC-like domain-containing protein n=1 Tax=Pigmentiphaga soli TaxID=1007095 RepID=A0ABP8GMH7_9BURK